MAERDGVDRNYTVVFIHGAGHCGSTLLNLMLNAHSQAIGLSELENIHGFFSPARLERIAAGADPEKTDFWYKVFSTFEANTGKPLLDCTSRVKPAGWTEYLDAVNAEDRRRTYEVNRQLMDAIAQVSKARVLCDASKFLIRAHVLAGSGVPLKVIHLQRDGRGVINSFLRKGKRLQGTIGRWRQAEVGYLLLRHWLPKEDVLFCRYEDLARRPEAVVRDICAYLDFPVQNSMTTQFGRTPHVGLSGNRMQHTGVSEVTLDESWRTELPRRIRYEFWLRGGYLQWITRAVALTGKRAPGRARP